MNTSQRRIRSLALAVCAFVFTASTLFPIPALANPTFPDSNEVNQDDDCGTPLAGVVSNHSDFWMQIRGNLEEGGPEDITYQLAPGENSEEDTNMCDVDYVNVQQDHWYLWYWRTRDSWPKIYSWNINCFNWWIPMFGTFVQCLAVWMDPGDGSPQPPIDPPGPGEGGTELPEPDETLDVPA